MVCLKISCSQGTFGPKNSSQQFDQQRPLFFTQNFVGYKSTCLDHAHLKTNWKNRPVLDQKNVFCCFSKIFTIKLIGSFLLLRKKIENWEIFVTATLLLWPGDQKLSKSKLYAVGKAPKWAPWAPWANIEIVGIYCFVSKKPEPSNLWALPNCCPRQSKMMNFWSKILLAKKSHCWNAGSDPCLLAILSASQANLCRSGF